MSTWNVARRHLDAARITLPAKVAAIIDTLDAVRAPASNAAVDLTPTALARLDAATIAERLTDAAQARTVAAERSTITHEVAGELEAAALAELRTVESHEHVIAALRPMFEEAVAIYTDAARLGVTHGMGADELARIGTDAVIAHARLTDASDLIFRVTLARGVTTGQALNAEHMVELDSVQPSRRTGSFQHEWLSSIDLAGASVPGILAAGMTPRLNTNAEAARVKQRAEVPPARVPAAEQSRERREQAADDTRHGTTAAEREAARAAARKAGRKTTAA